MQLKHLILASLVATSASLLLATSDTDSKIETAAKASYNYRTLLEDNVTVKVKDGIVTLTGNVADKDMKTIAEDTVSNLPGVLQVDNKLTLNPAIKENSDAWMEWKIRYQLLVRANVSNRDTKVVAKDGVVTLTGTAENLAQKELTEIYAKDMDGVKKVVNQITVLQAPPTEKPVPESIDDASVITQVKYALLSHKSTKAAKVKIACTDGAVVIKGEASSPAEMSLITKLAESIRGAKSVTNAMTVK